MGMKARDALAILKQYYSPFIHFSDTALAEAESAVRIFELNEGERLTIGAGSGGGFLYLLDGAADVVVNGISAPVKRADSKVLPLPCPARPATVDIVARGHSVLCHADSEALDYLLSWEELAKEKRDDPVTRSMHTVRNSLAFRRLPLEAVEEAFNRMQTMPVDPGTEVVKQGEEGDAFYVILEGEAEVWSQDLYDDEQKLVATLASGDTFGEQALIVSGTRTATVRMTTPGLLLRLSKADFDELVSSSMIEHVSPEVAKAMLDAKSHGLLDVRYEEEYDDRYVPDSVHIPLPELRRRFGELDAAKPYVVICAGGKRAAVATLLLKQRRVKAAVIEGGIRDWPFETASNY